MDVVPGFVGTIGKFRGLATLNFAVGFLWWCVRRPVASKGLKFCNRRRTVLEEYLCEILTVGLVLLLIVIVVGVLWAAGVLPL